MSCTSQAKWLWTVLRCIHGFCTEGSFYTIAGQQAT